MQSNSFKPHLIILCPIIIIMYTAQLNIKIKLLYSLCTYFLLKCKSAAVACGLYHKHKHNRELDLSSKGIRIRLNWTPTFIQNTLKYNHWTYGVDKNENAVLAFMPIKYSSSFWNMHTASNTISEILLKHLVQL